MKTLIQEHQEWRERMRVTTDQMRETRERREAVWGVSIGYFKDSRFYQDRKKPQRYSLSS
jgi:hypothetical protein